MHYDHARKLKYSPNSQKAGLLGSLFVAFVIYLGLLLIVLIGSLLKKVGLINDKN